jgi:phosphonate degradation associated HDIG domain protein
MTHPTPTPTSIADEIITLYRTHGQDNYGEDITQLQHAWQTAALARRAGYDDTVYLAAFLHDIGHFLGGAERMGDYGAVSHEKIGSAYLAERGFANEILALVEGHVAAKRYLCYRNPAYQEQLSDASKITLRYQGGPMTEAEATAFAAGPHFHKCLEMRTWDDLGKDPKLATGNLDEIHRLIVRHLSDRQI